MTWLLDRADMDFLTLSELEVVVVDYALGPPNVRNITLRKRMMYGIQPPDSTVPYSDLRKEFTIYNEDGKQVASGWTEESTDLNSILSFYADRGASKILSGHWPEVITGYRVKSIDQQDSYQFKWQKATHRERIKVWFSRHAWWV